MFGTLLYRLSGGRIGRNPESSRPFTLSENMIMVQLRRSNVCGRSIAILLGRTGDVDHHINHVLGADGQTWKKLHPKCFYLRYVLARLRNLFRVAFWYGIVTFVFNLIMGER